MLVLLVATAILCATAAAANAALPDHRVYEQVTPVEKGGVNPAAGDMAIPDASGNRVIVDAGFDGSLSTLGYSWQMRTRTSTGWTGGPELGPPAGEDEAFHAQLQPELLGVSGDFSQVLFVTGFPLNERDQNTDLDIYQRSSAGGPFTWMSGPPAPAVKTQGALAPPPNAPHGEPCGDLTLCYTNEAILAGYSSDLRHVVWGQIEPLVAPPAALPGSLADTHAQGYEVYESDNGVPRLVGLVPQNGHECGPKGGTCVVPPCGAAMGNERYSPAYPSKGGTSGFAPVHGAVSGDGAQVIFTSPDPVIPGCAPANLYMRVTGAETVEISASQKTNGSGPGGTDPNGPQPKWYLGSATEGGQITQVFFASKEELTNDANTGSADQGSDLYRYDVATGKLTDLTPDNNVADANGADVLGYVGAATDGSRVYFVAEGALAGGAHSGEPNLYVYDAATGKTTFVAPAGGMLHPQPDPPYGQRYDGVITPGGEDGDRRLTTRVTPDGEHVVFLDNSNLTSYDQHGYTEVYLYGARLGALTCVSCKPSGGPPVAGAMLPVNYPGGDGATSVLGTKSQIGLGTMPLPMPINDSGSAVFFDSPDQLTPAAPVPKQVLSRFERNVYEYEHGRLYLISPATPIEESGTAGTTSSLITTTPSGNDVFFNTMRKLLPQDADGERDIYDARVNGGFPEVSAPACSAAACQGVPSVPPIFATPATVTFEAKASTPSKGASHYVSRMRVLRRAVHRFHAVVVVRIPAAGRLTANGRGVRRVAQKNGQPGAVRLRLKLKLKRRWRRILRQHRRRKLRISLHLRFEPAHGRQQRASVHLRFTAPAQARRHGNARKSNRRGK